MRKFLLISKQFLSAFFSFGRLENKTPKAPVSSEFVVTPFNKPRALDGRKIDICDWRYKTESCKPGYLVCGKRKKR
jgi:hypothetical protein